MCVDPKNVVFLHFVAILPESTKYNIMKNYEDQAERRLRKVNDIKTMFWKRSSKEEKKDPKERMTII